MAKARDHTTLAAVAARDVVGALADDNEYRLDPAYFRVARAVARHDSAEHFFSALLFTAIMVIFIPRDFMTGHRVHRG